MINTDILIIGGGLSGLALAEKLAATGADFFLIEARNRLGGRIKSLAHNDGAYDLGPSWFWPSQPRIAALARKFGVRVFEQYASGALSYEDEQGAVMRNQGWSSMQGALRLEGGMGVLIEKLSKQLVQENYALNISAAKIVKSSSGIDVFDLNNVQVAQAKKVVFALPPRITAQFVFDPPLPEAAMVEALAVPTWMAGHAKFVAVYETPFWRDAGLSGDAMSRRGPLVEIHDASDPRSSNGALFGFLGVPASVRMAHQSEINAACLHQLAGIFGEQAAHPVAFQLQDWALESQTAIQADYIPPQGHPHYGMPPQLAHLWDGKLLFGSTEVAPQFGGFLEGALEAAELTAQQIMSSD